MFEKCLGSEFKEKQNAHCFLWFELSSQAGLAVPEPQKNVRGELVVLQNISHLHQLVQKNITGDQASLETGLDENDASIANIVRLLKFIPGKTFYEIGCKSWSAASKVNTLFRSPSFWLTHKRAGTTEFVAINMNINWNVQKEKYIKVINVSKNPQEHGQQTISCSVESSLPGWITLSRLFPTKLMRAGLWFHRKTWNEYRKYTFHFIWLRFRNSIWFLSSIPEVKNFIGAVEDEGRKRLVRKKEKKEQKMSSLSSSTSLGQSRPTAVKA